MFQYAAGLALARRLGTTLTLDPRQCHADTNRPFELHHFQISAQTWSRREQRWVDRVVRLARPVDSQTRGSATLFKAAVNPLLKGRFTYLEDRHQGYQSEFEKVRGHVYMAGTWASAEYFEPIEGVIRQEFRFATEPDEENAEMLKRIADAGCAVCVHVRRGDYMSVDDTSRRFGLCSVDYYEQAARLIADARKDCTAFVFSDDPDWARQNLKLPFETVYVTHNLGRRNFEDLRLMSACRHFIIANSTFSWWGAWLSIYSDKTIIAPKRWSVDPRGIGDPVKPDWIRI